MITNPPYSAKQDSQNDNNQNLDYPALDARIGETYASQSTATNKKNLYDSYICAIRWASDRVEQRGVVGFVTNGLFIDANNMDGLRASLKDEFASIYIFNLRGNARAQGEQRRREAGNVFGAGTRTPVAITLLVKNPTSKGKFTLRYHDIGDFLDRKEKLQAVRTLKSIRGINWQTLTPNSNHDWINKRDPAFKRFIVLGDKANESTLRCFAIYSQGVLTARDYWSYNSSKQNLSANIQSMINCYNTEMKRYLDERSNRACKSTAAEMALVNEVVDSDPKHISWSRSLKNDVRKGKHCSFNSDALVKSHYRPFFKQWLYFDKSLNEMRYQQNKLFPLPQSKNKLIVITGTGETNAFTTLLVDNVPDFKNHYNSQCFPLYSYEKDSGKQIDFTADGELFDGYRRHDAITDSVLSSFQEVYGDSVSKEDIFYYVYGILHSPEYRTRFAADLKKMLPRIPLTKEASDFWAFSKAGRDLAHWHLNYETIEPWPVKEHCGSLELDPVEHYEVKKMTFARPTAEQKAAGEKWDKTRIIYNSHITLSEIPLEAYEYVVNGKPAIEWIMERYQVTRDKDSGIVNDPNDWRREHNDPRYILDLVKRIVRVSIETMKIVKSLPALNEVVGKTNDKSTAASAKAKK